MADKVLIFISPKILGKGLETFYGLGKMTVGQEIKLNNISTWNLNGDILVEAYVKY